VDKVSFHSGAWIDYQEALDWYDARSARAAAGFQAAINAAVDRIVEAPQRWPLCDDRHRMYIMRRYPFSIVYRVEDDDVYIIAIAHSSRDAGYWDDRS